MPLEARESPQAYIARVNSVCAQFATLGLFSHISSLFTSTFVAKCNQWGVMVVARKRQWWCWQHCQSCCCCWCYLWCHCCHNAGMAGHKQGWGCWLECSWHWRGVLNIERKKSTHSCPELGPTWVFLQAIWMSIWGHFEGEETICLLSEGNEQCAALSVPTNSSFSHFPLPDILAHNLPYGKCTASRWHTTDHCLEHLKSPDLLAEDLGEIRDIGQLTYYLCQLQRLWQS